MLDVMGPASEATRTNESSIANSSISTVATAVEKQELIVEYARIFCEHVYKKVTASLGDSLGNLDYLNVQILGRARRGKYHVTELSLPKSWSRLDSTGKAENSHDGVNGLKIQMALRPSRWVAI